MQALASRIANVSLPNGAYDIFAKLRNKGFQRYGDYGMANDPRTTMMPPDQYIGARIPDLPTSADLETINERSTFQTRQDTMQRTLGMSSMSMPLQQQMGAPRQGIASALNAPSAAGDPKIDDTGWAVSLAQIVGSGKLTQEQLQRASYSSVYSMVRVDGGSEADHQEMAYYLQRMILEGYLRGVDITRDIQNEYGGSIRVQLTDGAVCSTTSTSIIGCGGMGYVQFRNGFWQNAGDGTKLALFYHEFGHEILNRPHNMVPSSLMGYDRFNNSWQSNGSTYNSLIDELFRNASGVNSTTAGPLATPEQIQQWLTGQGVTTGAPPLGPPGAPPGTTIQNTVTYNLMPTAVNPGSSSVGNIMTGNSIDPRPAGSGGEKTPVAGSLPDMASVQAFAAGLAEAAVKGSGIANLGSALLRLKSG